MRINLIPMAGEGQRFKDAGYQVPKPLIDVCGLPMVVRAAQALPPADKWIFVCRSANAAVIGPVLEAHFQNVVIVTVDALTEGQASTCMLARKHIPEDAVLTIGPSDNDMLYNRSKVESMFADPTIDGWIWTFRQNATVLRKPTAYGWVSCDAGGKALEVVCKRTISDDPFNDHAVIGAFTFKRAGLFFAATEAMMGQGRRVNNEFYVDVAADCALQAGVNLLAFPVEHYVGWGTPMDYENFQLWNRYFRGIRAQI